MRRKRCFPAIPRVISKLSVHVYYRTDQSQGVCYCLKAPPTHDRREFVSQCVVIAVQPAGSHQTCAQLATYETWEEIERELSTTKNER